MPDTRDNPCKRVLLREGVQQDNSNVQALLSVGPLPYVVERGVDMGSYALATVGSEEGKLKLILSISGTVFKRIKKEGTSGGLSA